MTSKHITLIVLSVFILAVLSLSIASATDCVKLVSVSVPTSIAHNAGSVSLTFEVTNNQSSCSTAKTGLNLSVTDSSGKTGAWTVSPSTISSLAYNDSDMVTATATFAAHQSGSITPQISMVGDGSESETLSLSIPISSSSSASIVSTKALTTFQNGTVNITNTGNTVLSNLNLSASGNLNVTLSDSTFTLAPGASRTVSVNVAEDVSDLHVGSHDVVLSLKDSAETELASYTYTLTGYFCDYGNVNASRIRIVSIKDIDSSNDWVWKPFDSIKIDVKLENNMDDDEDFVVELAIWDTKDKEFVEIDDEKSLEQDVSIDEDDSETVTFEFKAPVELEDSDGRYEVYVKAYVDGDEDITCNSQKADKLEIDRKSNDVIIDELVAPEIVQAGDTVRITGKASNIGTKDEDKVYVQISNTKLGLLQTTSSFSLDMSESDDFDISFVVPYTAENGVYSIRIVSAFFYSKSSDTYKKESDTYQVNIKVVGGVNGSSTSISTGYSQILPKLDDSNVVAGRDMSVTATIKNLGTNRTTFVISAKDYDSWATLSSISDRIITLDGGQSKDIKLVFAISKDASGEKTFSIESTAGTGKVDSKLVAVNIASSSWLSSLSGKFSSKSALIWIIGIVNLVLIILIILVAVKLAKR